MSKVKGLSAERIATRLLESCGYQILSTNFDIMDNGEKVAEIDIIAENDDATYAVEVKAGLGDVNAIRQAFGNAKLAGYKPMLVCKGYSDESAKIAAEKLDVTVIGLNEYYLLLEPEELEHIVKRCVEEVFETHGFLPYTVELQEKDKILLQLISTSFRFKEVAEKLTISEKALGKEIKDLTKRGILPKRSLSFRDLKQCAASVLSRHVLFEKLDRIEQLLSKQQN
ncbi:MAG: YraN family protein [Candidatus Thermoplasmatota archaeon]|nr:YraN family protein [Candidatus Thermoplasmatota archaeon]MBS3801564.1 YraN family protein [Candidatus Thermoplasmatota archaeon]